MGFTDAVRRGAMSAIRPFVKTRIEDAINREIKRRLPSLIERALMDRFTDQPDKPVSKVGFTWALVLYFHKPWPDISRAEAVACARDCLEIPYGTKGYDWTPASAKELVTEYVKEHGEAI